jgi:hypothetical protein
LTRISDSRQFWSGALFLGIGAVALWAVPRPLGTLAAMGSGYFPMLLGSGLVLLGFAAMVLGVLAGTKTRALRLPVVPTCCVLGGVLAVAALITAAGLAVSLLLLVAASSYKRLLSRPLEVLAIYVVLLPLTWFIFVYTIQLPIGLFW